MDWVCRYRIIFGCKVTTLRFDNKYFWTWSDDAADIIIIYSWININLSTFFGFFVRYFGTLHLDVLSELL